LKQILAQPSTDATVSADDVMIFELCNDFFQLAPPENDADSTFHQKLHDTAHNVQKQPHTEKDQHQREYTPLRADGIDLAVPDRGQGDGGHEHGVDHIPPLDDHVARGPETEQQQKEK